jgi:hypothetical protein
MLVRLPVSALVVVAALITNGRADDYTQWPELVRPAESVCLSPAPADGIYELNDAWPRAAPIPGSGQPVTMTRIAVVAGCLGLAQPQFVGWGWTVETRSGTDAASLHSHDGARCRSGLDGSFRRSAGGGLRAELTTFSECSGGSRTVLAPLELLPIASLPSGPPIKLLSSRDGTVRSAAVEFLASRQSEPAVCAALKKTVRTATLETEAVANRLLTLARHRCLLGVAEEATRSPGLTSPAAVAVIRLTDERRRRAALARVVARGGHRIAVELITKSLEANDR